MQESSCSVRQADGDKSVFEATVIDNNRHCAWRSHSDARHGVVMREVVGDDRLCSFARPDTATHVAIRHVAFDQRHAAFALHIQNGDARVTDVVHDVVGDGAGDVGRSRFANVLVRLLRWNGPETCQLSVAVSLVPC